MDDRPFIHEPILKGQIERIGWQNTLIFIAKKVVWSSIVFIVLLGVPYLAVSNRNGFGSPLVILSATLFMGVVSGLVSGVLQTRTILFDKDRVVLRIQGRQKYEIAYSDVSEFRIRIVNENLEEWLFTSPEVKSLEIVVSRNSRSRTNSIEYLRTKQVQPVLIDEFGEIANV